MELKDREIHIFMLGNHVICNTRFCECI